MTWSLQNNMTWNPSATPLGYWGEFSLVFDHFMVQEFCYTWSKCSDRKFQLHKYDKDWCPALVPCWWCFFLGSRMHCLPFLHLGLNQDPPEEGNPPMTVYYYLLLISVASNHHQELGINQLSLRGRPLRGWLNPSLCKCSCCTCVATLRLSAKKWAWFYHALPQQWRATRTK